MALSVASDGAFVMTSPEGCAANGELFVLAMNEAKTDGWLYLGRRAPD